MDIIQLSKKQISMKRISKELRYSENEIDLFTPDFEKNNKQDKELLEKDDQSESSDDESTEQVSEVFDCKNEEKSFSIWEIVGNIL